jgi:hypothetical protein
LFDLFLLCFYIVQCTTNITQHLHDGMSKSAQLLTLMPSQRDTARSGLKALNVLIERNAGISAAPAIIAPKFINESFNVFYTNLNLNFQ